MKYLNSDAAPFEEPANAGSLCLFFDRTAVIMCDGEVVTCANMFAETVGRLDGEKTFFDIWNGARMRSLRSCFGTPEEWRQCRTCWFREVRYYEQRSAWSRKTVHALEAASDYNKESWDFRRYRDEVGS